MRKNLVPLSADLRKCYIPNPEIVAPYNTQIRTPELESGWENRRTNLHFTCRPRLVNSNQTRALPMVVHCCFLRIQAKVVSLLLLHLGHVRMKRKVWRSFTNEQSVS